MMKRTWRPPLAFNALLAFALWSLLALVLWVWDANPAAAQARRVEPVWVVDAFPLETTDHPVVSVSWEEAAILARSRGAF